MTIKMYWQDPYLTQLETQIATVDGADVTVAATIFYALSGGQESDNGTIDSHTVMTARKSGLDIVYTLAENHGFIPGQAVTIKIDWLRRYRLMRLHFAAEIVLELVYKLFGDIEKIGAHIGEAKARIDFAWPENIASTFPELTQEAMRIITDDQTIKSGFSDAVTQRRFWEISEFAPVPCGGTHLKSTGEIGPIALKRKNIGKNKERIEITLIDPSA